MPTLLIALSKLPVLIETPSPGRFRVTAAFEGVSSGINALSGGFDIVWVGYPGCVVRGAADRLALTSSLWALRMVPVFLSSAEACTFFGGFACRTIFPHFHYFTQTTAYNDSYFSSYQSVNQRYSARIADFVAEHGTDYVWVHDYHFLLLPQLLRERVSGVAGIGFFLHIPFPSSELFRTLPWRRELVMGMLGADYVAFHSSSYMLHFVDAVRRVCGIECGGANGRIAVGGRLVSVGSFPVGIDYELYSGDAGVASGGDWDLRALHRDVKTIVSVQSLDYTRGIAQHVRAYGRFLARNPGQRGRVCLVEVAVPPRYGADAALKSEIELLVGKVCGRFDGIGWASIHYTNRRFSVAETIALFRQADVCLLTPLRDGAGLVAKQYVAAAAASGVLILSEMSGAADQLEDAALIVNPNDQQDIVLAIERAVAMPADEQRARLAAMQDTVRTYNVRVWAEVTMRGLLEAVEADRENRAFQLVRGDVVAKYRAARRRLLLLKYDGTLVPLDPNPARGVPDQRLKAVLERLVADPRNQVVVVSGRDRRTLDAWLGAERKLDFAGEDGVWIKTADTWNCAVVDGGGDSGWKAEVREVLERLCSATPGTRIEERVFALLWHFRGVERDSVNMKIGNYERKLKKLAAKYDLQYILARNLVKIRPRNIKKGHAAMQWLRRPGQQQQQEEEEEGAEQQQQKWDFILAIGDDCTDEDTFEVVNATDKAAYTVKVGGFGGGGGAEQTAARYGLLDVTLVRALMDALVEEGE